MRFLLLLSLFCLPATVMAQLPCTEADTTVAMNACLEAELEKADNTMQRYLEASRERYQDNQSVLTAISKAQDAWQQYRDDHCNSLYTIWIDGTIRGPIGWRCLIDKTQQRSHELWSTYLNFMDSQEPLLPEPEPSP